MLTTMGRESASTVRNVVRDSYLCICSSLLFFKFTFGHWEKTKNIFRYKLKEKSCAWWSVKRSDLKDGGNQQPVPLQVLLVI